MFNYSNMFKGISFFVLILINFPVFSEENLLTIKQQLDRLQRDVNDISRLVFQNKNSENDIYNNQSDTINSSAFDMRIYDLEKDIKNLNSNFENLVFEIDEIKIMFEELNTKLNDLIISNTKVIESPAETTTKI